MTGEVKTYSARINTLKAALEKSIPNFRAVAARHLAPERMVKVILGAASRTPALLECTPLSIVRASLQAAELGLEPGSSLGEFYLVPFRNRKTNEMEAQGIPGYRGLIALARRSGEISNLFAEVVYQGDSFEVEFGLDSKLVHKPSWSDGRESAANLMFVYAVARFKDGSYQFAVMSRSQVDGIRRRSKASDSGPWVTDYEEMAKKTVIRRLAKQLPLTVELGRALALEAAAEAGEMDADVLDVISIDTVEGADYESKAEELAQKLAAPETKP